MKGFSFSGGELKAVNNGRTIFTSKGKLFNGLPTTFETTIEVAFPDFPKGKAYRWTWESNYNSIGNVYGWNSAGTCIFGRVPSNWSATSVIGSVPSGVNLMISRLRLHRTVVPTHPWLDKTINVIPGEDIWLAGREAKVEEQFGMVRAFAIYIDGNDLKLYRQQTVGPASGGYGTANQASPSFGQSSSGQTWHDFGTPCLPVWGSSSSPYFRFSDGTSGASPPFGEFQNQKWDGSNPASQVDPTNYASTYSVDLYGRFARRS